MYPIGWSMCPKTNSYLQGINIDDQTSSSGKYRIEEGKCSAGEVSFTNQPAICTNANWAAPLDG